MGIEGTYNNIVKAIYDELTANIIINGEKLKVFPLRSGIRQGCPLTTLIQHSSGSPSYTSQRIKRNKRNPGWKRRSKLSLFADDMILYIEYPKDSIRKLLISEFNKVSGYKINTQKSLAFLYTNNEKSERAIKESIPFTMATKIIKYLGINLYKEMKEWYTENYNTLMKEIKK